jgi:hypothetical protein
MSNIVSGHRGGPLERVCDSSSVEVGLKIFIRVVDGSRIIKSLEL